MISDLHYSPASLRPIPWTLLLPGHLAFEYHWVVCQAEAESPSCPETTQWRAPESITRV